ncbi:hypothetical protein [Campylobacter showae]|uniref:Uncharacterized protein n=1 Tax=Campylobacter showae CSUNSWCD TaxID=1244083 RepID=M5IQA4_9BACT|nr:hypothetical protein [Campylobacter showae]EKU11404.1 hypothetical protein CSUNSWCD_2030 [Campylobacter showae CSUNSWCD]
MRRLHLAEPQSGRKAHPEAQIEYIEFAKFYDFVSRGALLPPEHKSQGLDAIARYLERLGKFEMEPGEQSLEIYGHKR